MKGTIHKKEIIINKEKLLYIIKQKGLNYTELYDKIVYNYGLDITYKGFNNLLNNRSIWKLIYAYCIVDYLDISIKDIFEVIDIDVEKRREEKRIWKEKYEKVEVKQ